MTMPLIENQVRLQYKLLGHEGFYTRVRWDDKQTNKGGKEELVSGIDQLITWAKPLCGKANLYLSRNPFTKDGRVAGVSSFTVDLDPVREPKDRAATDDELSATLRFAQRINAESFDLHGVLSTSGNGTFIIVPFPTMEEDVDGYTKQAQEFERELIKKYSTNEVRIDATNYAKALVKLLGSVSTKGDPKLHRYARTLGPVLFRRSDRLLSRIRTNKSTTVQVPDLPVSHGDFKSRSEADYALASRLKLSGFDAGSTLKALQDYGFRPDRQDDYRRIVNKLYGQQTATISDSSDRINKLWTPGEGLPELLRKPNLGGRAISTGFKWLDEKLFGGYLPGRVYAVEAPTNVGKSTYIVQAAFNSCRSGKRVLLVATEMDAREFCERWIALKSGLPAATVFSGDNGQESSNIVARFEEAFRGSAISVCYTTTPNQKEIEGYIETIKPDIILWDYFQHFETGTDNRQVQLGSLARWFESTAIRFDVPFVVAAQLHERFDFKSRSRLPALKDDIKDCKVLNDTSKVVLVLDWDKQAVTTEDGPIGVSLSIQKNKGPQSMTKLLLRRNIPQFEEI